MDPGKYVMVYDSLCSVIIFLSILTAIVIWRNYKISHQKASLMLFVFMIWLAIAYLEQAVVMTLTHQGTLIVGSKAHMMLSGICFTMGAGVAAAAATLFAILTLKPRHMKFFCALPVAVAVVHCLIFGIFGEIILPAGEGLVEWFPSAPLKISMIAVAIMAFVPAFLFFVYGMSVQTFRQKVSGLTLTIGLLMLAYFTFVSDNFSIAPTLLYRRICITAGIFVVYLGFATPRWYLKLIKRIELGVKKELGG